MVHLEKWDRAPSLGGRRQERHSLVGAEKGISLGEAPGSRPQEPQIGRASCRERV